VARANYSANCAVARLGEKDMRAYDTGKKKAERVAGAIYSSGVFRGVQVAPGIPRYDSGPRFWLTVLVVGLLTWYARGYWG
jgi:hypothetical protein